MMTIGRLCIQRIRNRVQQKRCAFLMFLLPKENKVNKKPGIFLPGKTNKRASTDFLNKRLKKFGWFVFIKPDGEMVENDFFYGNSA